MINKKVFVAFLVSFFSLSSCTTTPLKVDDQGVKALKDLGDFGGAVEISKDVQLTDKNIVATKESKEPAMNAPKQPVQVKKEKKKFSTVSNPETSKEKKKQVKTAPPVVEVPSPIPSHVKLAEPLLLQHEPSIEDSVGFEGRRPIADPFRVGETVIHDVSYFKVSAGQLKLKVEPFANVNGKKSYTFAIEINSNSMFSSFYSVEDRAETLVDYETLVPHVFSLHVKESGQMREAKSRFDHVTNQAYYFEKKITKKDGLEEKKQNWEMPPFSQNVYSAIFYMRLFKWDIGKEYTFRVAHDNENIVFRGKALRKEKLETQAGTFNTIVIKPEFTIKGAFRPVGDIFFWMSDDDRKLVLRIESHIKIGTLVSEAVQIIH